MCESKGISPAMVQSSWKKKHATDLHKNRAEQTFFSSAEHALFMDEEETIDAIVVREEEEAHVLFSFLYLGKNRSR
jgi:hypothetical protein